MARQSLLGLSFEEGTHTEMEEALAKVEGACSADDFDLLVLSLRGPALSRLAAWKRMLPVIAPAVHTHKEIRLLVPDESARLMAKSSGFGLLADIQLENAGHPAETEDRQAMIK